MKKRIVPVILALPLLLQAHTMQQLFDALKKQPQTKEDTLLVKEADTALKSTYAKLYPSVGAFARYDYYTTETGLLPVPPNKMFPMIKNPDIPQPFSKRIARVGLSIGMPVFVKSIFTYAKKTEALRASADAARKINLLKNEAIIVGANASLQYMEAMRKALLQKKASLQKTRSFIDMKVKKAVEHPHPPFSKSTTRFRKSIYRSTISPCKRPKRFRPFKPSPVSVFRILYL